MSRNVYSNSICILVGGTILVYAKHLDLPPDQPTGPVVMYATPTMASSATFASSLTI